ncbi:MAG: MerR family transcriptional regulator [Clostridiales Family XIII bacterium]|nr:MerR family transcriptional regulator [Clostridiales Family XIII bacterium]
MIVSIGEFSRISSVPTTTLRFWERTAILKPTWVNPQNGYRYYDAALLKSVSTILALQNCGFKNKEIKNCVSHELPTELFVNKFAELQSARKKIESAMQYLTFFLGDATSRHAVVAKRIPEMQYIVTRRIFKDRNEIHRKLAEIVEYIIKGNIVSKQPYQTMGVYYSGERATRDIDYECRVRVVNAPSDCPYEIKKTPAVNLAASILHKGSYEIPNQYYDLLLRWINENGYIPCGETREWFITDPYDGKTDTDSHISEMQIPIRVAGP